MLPSVRRRALMGVCAFSILAGACGGNAAESGVNVKTVVTDLAFGIPESPKPAPPANTGGTPTDPLGVVDQGGDPEATPRPPIVPIDPCPEAPPNLFPEPAPAELSGAPAEGTYRWRIEGTQVVTGVGKIRMPGFTDRIVSDSEVVNGAQRFTVEERDLVFGSQYNVRTTYEYRRGGVDESEQGVNVDRTGLYLVKVERIHRSNPDSNTEFNPSPPVLVIPTPVRIGDSVSSTGVDPVSFEVLQQEGDIVKRIRVDACGKPQDAFWVEGFRSFVAADGRTTRAKYHYGIATVMGGLPIVEHLESPCIDDSEGVCAEDSVMFEMDAHIGQLEPAD
jgi:hypothetical protein